MIFPVGFSLGLECDLYPTVMLGLRYLFPRFTGPTPSLEFNFIAQTAVVGPFEPCKFSSLFLNVNSLSPILQVASSGKFFKLYSISGFSK